MAGLTGYRAVPTGKFKFRVAIMIELRLVPLLGVVAVLTLVAVTPVVESRHSIGIFLNRCPG